MLSSLIATPTSSDINPDPKIPSVSLNFRSKHHIVSTGINNQRKNTHSTTDCTGCEIGVKCFSCRSSLSLTTITLSSCVVTTGSRAYFVFRALLTLSGILRWLTINELLSTLFTHHHCTVSANSNLILCQIDHRYNVTQHNPLKYQCSLLESHLQESYDLVYRILYRITLTSNHPCFFMSHTNPWITPDLHIHASFASRQNDTSSPHISCTSPDSKTCILGANQGYSYLRFSNTPF